MKITVKSTLDIPFEQVRKRILRPDTMQLVSKPIVHFTPVAPAQFPMYWDSGKTYNVKLMLLGYIPLGMHNIKPDIRKDTTEMFVMVDVGSGQMAKQWDHSITIQRDGFKTRYRDEVNVRAKLPLLTPVVAGFAWIYYHHRQRRLKNLP